MKIKLLWSNTGDHLLFDAINKDLAAWFIETSQQLGNNYSVANMVTDVPWRSQDTVKLIEEITYDIDRVNKFLVSMNQVPVNSPRNWNDQKQLNQLHKDWATTRFKWPKLTELLYKIDPSLFDSYHRMNCHIHLIEQSLLYDFRDPTHWRVTNPFKDVAYGWEACHLAISYPGHGRNAFEKFQNLDDDPANIEVDNVNWDNVDASLEVYLRRPYKITPPAEFLSWCDLNQLVPHTDNIPLGNITDWPNNLTNARELFMKNNKIADNPFSLMLV
jgi:hypothetical protein